eukprot:scaffold40124_cov65-Phaeocystis_antarctica.AAC.3
MSGHVQACPPISGHVQACPSMSKQVRPGPGMSGHVQAYPGMSRHVQACPSMPRHVFLGGKQCDSAEGKTTPPLLRCPRTDATDLLSGVADT